MCRPILGWRNTEVLFDLADTAGCQYFGKQGIVLRPDGSQLCQFQTGKIDRTDTQILKQGRIERRQPELMTKEPVFALQQTVVRTVERFVQHSRLPEQHRLHLYR